MKAPDGLRIGIGPDYGGGAGLFLTYPDPGCKDSVMVAQPLEFKQETDGVMIDPVVRLNRSHIQQLMDELWMNGYRPSRGVSSAGQLESTQAHLNDMRVLASAALQIQLPGIKQ